MLDQDTETFREKRNLSQ